MAYRGATSSHRAGGGGYMPAERTSAFSGRGGIGSLGGNAADLTTGVGGTGIRERTAAGRAPLDGNAGSANAAEEASASRRRRAEEGNATTELMAK